MAEMTMLEAIRELWRKCSEEYGYKKPDYDLIHPDAYVGKIPCHLCRRKGDHSQGHPWDLEPYRSVS